jgi:hypothetical protein
MRRWLTALAVACDTFGTVPSVAVAAAATLRSLSSMQGAQACADMFVHSLSVLLAAHGQAAHLRYARWSRRLALTQPHRSVH